MPSAKSIREMMVIGPFGHAGRLALAGLYASRRLRRGIIRLPLADGGCLYVSRRTLGSDFQTLRQMFVPRKNDYRTNYDGAIVVDIGAHKGYYGAFALLSGARRVYSYEPASENYRLLSRTAESFRRRGLEWETQNAAVGASSGSSVLQVSAESWAHTLHTALPRTGPARSISSEEVEVLDAAVVLEGIAAGAKSDKVIVKIDAEGAECEICTQTDPAAWAPVDELFVEVHDFAACDRQTLLTHLWNAGLEPSRENDSVINLARRRGHIDA